MECIILYSAGNKITTTSSNNVDVRQKWLRQQQTEITPDRSGDITIASYQTCTSLKQNRSSNEFFSFFFFHLLTLHNVGQST